jgi:hypothetical protein
VQGPSLELEMRLKDQKVQVGMDALAAKEDKVATGLDKIGKNARAADAELNRFAKRTTEINTTPLEKYNRTLFVLDQALARGKVSQEIHSRALKRAGDDYHAAAHPVNGMARALSGVVQQYAGWGAAIGFVTSALNSQVEKSQQAVRSLQEMLNLRIELGQVSPELEAQIGPLTKQGLTRTEAGNLLLQGQNLGFSGDVDWIAKHKAGLGDLSTIGDTAGLIPGFFNGAINARQAINMTGVAAEPSRLTPGAMAQIMGRASAGAVPTADSADATYSAASLLAQKYATPEMMATALGFMQTKLSTHGSITGDTRFDGKNIYESMVLMQELEKSEPDVLWGEGGILGKDKERNEFFLKAKQIMPEMPARMEMMRKARLATDTPEQWADKVTQRNLANPKIGETLKGIGAQQDYEAAVEKRYGLDGNEGNKARLEYLAAMENRKLNPLAILAADWTMQGAQHFSGADVPGILSAGGTAARVFSGGNIDMESLQSWKDAKEAAAALKEAAAALKEASRSPGSVTRSVSASALVPQN